MSYKRPRYTSNNQNWLFFHPTIGDNWTHLVEKECFADSENYDETEPVDLENQPPIQKESSLAPKLALLTMAIAVLVGGVGILLQVPQMAGNVNLTEKNISLTEKLQ
ncbi:MAG: hypothetical protein QNJ38_05215 [Prochloraceae cyanobacterium]|nr:hypothetical protein [Prochloraceae cyanobacterium]